MSTAKCKVFSIVLAFAMLISMFSSVTLTVSAEESQTTSYLLGDADMDGKVTIKDATLIQLSLVSLQTLDDKQLKLADCNADEGVQISDATLLQKYIAKINMEYPENANGYTLGDYVTFEEKPSTEPTTETQPTTAPVTTVPVTTVPATEPTESNTTTITVGVISYVYEETKNDSASYKVHYWGGSATSDASCTALNTTEKRSVGSSYWGNAEQTFYMYTAVIPSDATGFKFHIGDRWFGDDGNTASQNAVYIFNYSGDKALYTKVATVNPTEPTNPVATTAPQTTSPVTTTPSTGKTISVGVISYIYDDTSSDISSYKVHYWGGSTLGDASCTALNTTEIRSVGSEFWSNAEQTFHMFTSVIPSDATGFKFHIGDRWFGDDGNTASQNAVYIFNYSGDKALYTTVKVNPTVPTTAPTTEPEETTTSPQVTTAPTTTPTTVPTTAPTTSPTTIPTTTPNAEQSKLSYTFSGSNASTAGYAEGTVSLTAKEAGTYYLYWADNTKGLDGYYEICKLSLSANATGKFTFDYHTAIPANATKLIATTSTTNTTVSNADAVYDIPATKQLKYSSGELKYTFNSYSDVHIDPDGYYKNYRAKWAQALKFATNKNTDFIVSSGDMVNFGLDSEWEIYEEILADSDYVNPVYESNGNHDLRSNIENGKTSFVRATGTDNTTANYDANKPYYYVREKSTGDIFIFMALEGDYKTHTVESFSQEQLNWVTNLLETYYNTGVNIYIIEHAAIEGFGAGDRMDNPLYKSHLSQSFSSTLQFKSLLQKYPKLIWMSGHTHIDYELGYNYSNENGTACHMIHNSAVIGSTKEAADGTSLDYNEGNGYNSQGYYVEVYNNQVIYYGANLTDEKIYPEYCYIMDGSRSLGTANEITDNTAYGTGTTNLLTVLAYAKNELDTKYSLASYDQYQAVKKLYYKYKGYTAILDESAVVAEIEAKIADLKAIAAHIGCPELYSTYYFVNKSGWSSVYGYAWNGSDNNTWPGEKLEKVGTYNGYSVYEINFAYLGEYRNLIFNDGADQQTVDISLNTSSGNCFILNGSTDNGKYKVDNIRYTPVEISPYMLRYYNSPVHSWDDMDTYFTAKGDGTYVLNFTTVNDAAISCNVYNTDNAKFNCVSASTSMDYISGSTNTFNLSASSSRGKSITINGLQAGVKLTFVYNPTSNTLKITCG